jgi:hypothetical protein
MAKAIKRFDTVVGERVDVLLLRPTQTQALVDRSMDVFIQDYDVAWGGETTP